VPRNSVKPRRIRNAAHRSSAIAWHSTAYIVTVMGAVLRSTPLDALDLLITLAISAKNGDGAQMPRGVSRNAVSRTLNVPLETVRRRVALLLKKRVIAERTGGLVVPADAPLGRLPNNAELLAFNAQTVRQLFADLKAKGVRLD